METIESKTCIKFKKRLFEENFIDFFSGNYCSSYIGMIEGRQRLNLNQNNCMNQRTIVHEILHALGFDHMQNHPKRDDFIRVVWENISKGDEHNFEMLDKRFFSNYGTPYDFDSIMHYDPYIFSKNGGRTIEKKKKRKIFFFEFMDDDFGWRDEMSSGDIERINRMYDCKV